MICTPILFIIMSVFLIDIRGGDWTIATDILNNISGFMNILLIFFLFKSLIGCLRVAEDSDKLRNELTNSLILYESSIKQL
jgi:hypothetical protein